MNGELMSQLCIVMWLPTIIVVWLILTFPPRLNKRKRR